MPGLSVSAALDAGPSSSSPPLPAPLLSSPPVLAFLFPLGAAEAVAAAWRNSAPRLDVRMMMVFCRGVGKG